ncbi:MAG: hypothetical protein ACTSPQ_22550, partial [Candidatus Helarchaeota archaeon]
MTDSFIFVISMRQKFPLIKFTKEGRYIKKVSRLGPGPGEIKGQLIHKIIFKNDKYYIEKNFYDAFDETLTAKMVDIKFIDKNHLLVCNYGNASHHLLVLKIGDKKLDIVQRIYPLPPSASLLRILGWGAYHGLNKSGNSFISNFAYPPYIIESFFNGKELTIKKVIKNLNFKNFQKVDSTVTLKSLLNKNTDFMVSVYHSISKFRWLTKMKYFYIGSYMYYSEEIVKGGPFEIKKGYHKLFFINNNKVIYERNISNKTLSRMLTFDDYII